MEYTEKEKKGIDKVERMNRLFDRILLPAVGILIIMLLFSFVINRYREKFGAQNEISSLTTSQQPEPEVFALRRKLMADYGAHKKEFEAYGYTPVGGYSYALSLCKVVDEEMSLFQFSDDALGELTIVSYFPKDSGARYDSLSLGISSHKLLTVTAKSGEESCSVTFLSYDFSIYKSDDEDEYKALMKLTDMDEIAELYAIFEADISNLAETCEGKM